MWFVLEMNTEKTIAMTEFKDAAYIIAENFPAQCIIRYAAEIETGYSKEALFFSDPQEMKRGA